MEFRSVPLEVLKELVDCKEFACSGVVSVIDKLTSQYKRCRCHCTESVESEPVELKSMPSHVEVTELDGDSYIVPMSGLSISKYGEKFVASSSISGPIDLPESEYKRLKKILVGE